MKIKDIRASVHTTTIEVPLLTERVPGYGREEQREFVFCEVETDDGVTGVALTGHFLSRAVVVALEQHFLPVVVDMDPRELEAIHQRVWRSLNPRAMTGVVSSALSLLDIALWDIKGKAAGRSVASLLGGARTDVPVYVTFGFPQYDRETLTAAAQLQLDQGFTALKLVVAVSALALVIFIVVVLGGVSVLAGFSLLRLITVLRKELAVVLGTSSSEAVLPQLMERLEQVGCRRSVVGLVAPTGFSFNLDGVAVVIPICVVFIGQVYGIPLTFGDQLGLFLIFLVLSKGTAGISGSAFITLANTVAATSLVPIAGLALVLSVDRFLSLIRALTNVLGNAVATVVIARWEPGGLDRELAARTIGWSRPKNTVGEK
ncbi:cation:dicarboxylate symporter family transporter [Nocardia brasiliensis]|uniref:Sodium:dicarboxylate symporter n=1 Tax=Nocardia brasiliensis (strain ATCC 700358 / HUJEG-1) TaxID=1133849 RepID=K0EZR8_NOCB7|nr:cation:dicarboxylase symporter family transporter [Nocardia brasiliensis]AFU00896.1 sodium:dicarboxylate symporter [Nocardia brasiliensis ATCC 700358]